MTFLHAALLLAATTLAARAENPDVTFQSPPTRAHLVELFTSEGCSDCPPADILLDTPWATVLTGGPERMTTALASAIDGVLSGQHHAVAPPHLPTEDEWAGQVAGLCGWVK